MASTLTNLLYHLVFSTKHREPIITPDLRDPLYAYIGGIIRSEGGILIEAGGMPDHIHLVAKFKPDTSVSDMVQVFKAKSSKWVNEMPDRTVRFAWQTGFGGFTVSESQLPIVRRYVRTQEEHHRTVTFQEEYLALLKRHRIEYDERYVFD